ncbi:hypothetical protein [Micromonospora sp. S-DT3-3-22]|uniref:hypothetical protein n=1 Tax=Micromonospora sp. S-DT3-3-22 TaxID=2755359 RepID=UPI00189004BF|nr:hypothetical protein [Micromonospora sp. S-DT3-3-22]
MPDLEAPRREEELYLARQDEVNPLRPPMTGDVYCDVAIPGVSDEEDPSGEGLAMILAHPCSMREGPVLRQRIPVARVVPWNKEISFGAWRSNHISIMPLPHLIQSSKSEMYAVVFERIGRVDSAELEISRRTASLTEYGIAVMQQRRIFFDTRAVVEIDALMEACAGVILETELAEEWNDALIDVAQKEEGWLDAALASEAQAFYEMLHLDRTVPGPEAKKVKKYKLSDDIQSAARRPQVKRAVLSLLKEEQAKRSTQVGVPSPVADTDASASVEVPDQRKGVTPDAASDERDVDRL